MDWRQSEHVSETEGLIKQLLSKPNKLESEPDKPRKLLD